MNKAPQDGRYQLTANDDGVYLSVWPPVNGGEPVKRPAIVQELTERGYGEFDGRFISRIIRDALGTAVKVIHWRPRSDGRYQITANDRGIYLSVWPPAGGGVPVARAAVMKELTERNYNGFNEWFLALIIREAAGVPVLIVNSQPLAPVRPSIRVKVRLDRMEARLSVSIPEGSAPVTMLALLTALQAAGVVSGIDRKALEKLTHTKRLASNIVCARGQQPRHGQPAVLRYAIELVKNTAAGGGDKRPRVEPGQLLVEKIPATPGVPGRDVFGFSLPAQAGKDLRLPAGRYVVSLDNRLYAVIAGELGYCSDQRVDILPTASQARAVCRNAVTRLK